MQSTRSSRLAGLSQPDGVPLEAVNESVLDTFSTAWHSMIVTWRLAEGVPGHLGRFGGNWSGSPLI